MTGWPERLRGQPEWIAKLRKTELTPWRERPVELKYKQAICRQFKYGLTNQQIADQIGVSPTTYTQKKNSHEGKALLKALEEFRGDDKAIVEASMRDEAYHSFENLIEARDRMYEASQYEAAAKIDLKILEAIGFWQKQKVDLHMKGDQVILNLGGRDMEALMASPTDAVEADFEIVSETT